MQKFCGGIFVLLQLAFALFCSFEGLIFSYEQTLSAVLSVWLYSICSVTLYAVSRPVIRTGDIRMINNYDPNKKYDVDAFVNFTKYSSIPICFIGLVFTFLELFRPFFLSQSIYGYILTFGYILVFYIPLVIAYIKYGRKIVIKEEKEI